VSEERAEQIVNDYFEQLGRALLPMHRHRRDQLLDELRSHVEAARAGSPIDSEAAVREALERLGDPEEIATEALSAPHARRRGWTVFIPRWSVIVAGSAAALIVALVLVLVLPESTPTTSSSALARSAPVVAVGGFPTGIAIDPSHQTVYVAAGDANSLSMFAEATCKAADGARCADPRSVPTGGQDPIGVVADPSLETLYVVNGGSNTLAVINTATCNASDYSRCNSAPTLVPVPGGPEFLALDSATQTVYLADTTTGTVSVFDAQTCNAHTTKGCGHPLATSPVGAGAFPIAVDQATNTVYVGTNRGVAVIDGSTCRGSDITGCSKDPVTVPLSTIPAGIAVDDAHHTLYVSGESGSVAVINTSSCKGSDTKGCSTTPTMVSVGADARGATLDSATSTLYVANADSDTVSMLDTDRCNASIRAGCRGLPKAVPVGSSPRRIAIGQASGTAYVVNVLGNSVSLISTQSCNANEVNGCPDAHPEGTSEAQGDLEPSSSSGSASSSALGAGTGSNSTCTPTIGPMASGAAASTVSPSWPVAASGSIEGMSWSLRTASGQSGANAIENGALILNGRAYGLCPGFPNPAELQLVDAGANGIVVGVVGYPDKATVQLSESTAGTFATGTSLPVPDVQVVQGVSFFIGSLPQSACDYPSIELNATAAGVSTQHNLGFGTCVANQIVPITESQGEWDLPTSRAQSTSGSANGAIVTEPTQSAPSLPPAGKQPANPASAKADVESVFKAVYGQGTSGQKLRLVQGADQTVIAAANAAASAHARVSASSAPVVLQVVFTDPKDAAVLYEIDYQGSPVVGPKIGYAVLDGGVWKVTRATFCADINNAGTGVTC
jgi:DNA-binding beta-propeller fold protein YncE